MVKLDDIAKKQGLIRIASFSDADDIIDACYADPQNPGRVGCLITDTDISEQAEREGVMNLITKATQIDEDAIEGTKSMQGMGRLNQVIEEARNRRIASGLPAEVEANFINVAESTEIDDWIERSLEQGYITQQEAKKAKKFIRGEELE